MGILLKHGPHSCDGRPKVARNEFKIRPRQRRAIICECGPAPYFFACNFNWWLYLYRERTKKKNTHQPTDQPTNRIIPARRHGLDLWLTKRPTMEYFFKKEKKNLANKTHSKSWLVGGKTTAATNEWLEGWGNANETNKHKKKEKEKSGHNSDE